MNYKTIAKFKLPSNVLSKNVSHYKTLEYISIFLKHFTKSLKSISNSLFSPRECICNQNNFDYQSYYNNYKYSTELRLLELRRIL